MLTFKCRIDMAVTTPFDDSDQLRPARPDQADTRSPSWP